MKEINFIQDVFESMVLSAACACKAHDDEGNPVVGDFYVEVTPK